MSGLVSTIRLGELVGLANRMEIDFIPRERKWLVRSLVLQN